MKPGWFLLGFCLGAVLGAAGAVVGLEAAVRQHYYRATVAEVKLGDCAHELAVERSWASLVRNRGKR